jgi:hypothetical protein
MTTIWVSHAVFHDLVTVGETYLTIERDNAEI